ncbi:MAG: TetR family transcriptional regulator [Kordiimonadaceae bacterium]|nr:TetR family transcriptional regulator [Kordiimonadaceae bacterium]MBO6567279.1 TetR family transcriptional regulator [Kordiimonadaceae bacterium]MBO6963507.1 TetR family transcriptional regulator [Kordiimonadaceae bacterium]
MNVQNGNKLKRADATRIALIEAAERLIAEKGLADVSTREILQEAGQRNQSALQYHFGSKKGLISATINERTKQIDRVRQEMLEKVGDNPSMRQLIEVLIMPLADLMREKAAGANYLNFLSQAITQPEWELRRVLEEFNVVGMLKAYELLDAKFENMSEKERLTRQYVLFDFAILALNRWCLDEKPERSLEDTLKFVIDGSLALAKLD